MTKVKWYTWHLFYWRCLNIQKYFLSKRTYLYPCWKWYAVFKNISLIQLVAVHRKHCNFLAYQRKLIVCMILLCKKIIKRLCVLDWFFNLISVYTILENITLIRLVYNYHGRRKSGRAPRKFAAIRRLTPDPPTFRCFMFKWDVVLWKHLSNTMWVSELNSNLFYFLNNLQNTFRRRREVHLIDLVIWLLLYAVFKSVLLIARWAAWKWK